MEENISEICTDRVCDFITPSTAGNRVMEKNGLFSSARRDKFSSTPSVHEKPAELFRKDLISAMKLADSEHLEEKEYLGLQDPWRQDWEKGVQVPVALDAIPDLSVRVVPENETLHGPYGFKLPKKFLHAVKDENYRTSQHELHESHKLAEEICRYDLDDFDVTWLQLVNEERDGMGEEAIEEWVMERVMESLETQCYNNMQNMIKTVEGLGIEYDENVVCDVCRSPEGEDNNEMVFCDSCDLCVHQACYGIVSIPEGSWLCRTCATGVQPKCMLCPKLGGAMKSSKSGSKWAHVSCALWIPEVNFVNPEKMEPITNISNIPSSRWSLVCSICREKTGACIQCAVKSCKTAFHVTCGFQANLDMKTLFNEDSDQVQLKGYCMKHTRRRDGDNTPRKSENKKSETPKKECDMTEEEKTEARSAKLAKLAEEFYTCVTPDEVAGLLNLDKILVDYICAYWILKRKANFNKPLMTPKTEEAELLSKQREDSLIARMKMFIHLRQDLERVRNLCYMVSKREKMSKQLSRLKEEVFYKQVDVLDKECNSNRIAKREFASIIQAHKIKDSVYDSHDKIIAFSKVVEKIAQDESVKDEQPSIAPKARIKFEPHRQQRSEVNPKKLKDVSKEESSSEVDVINLPKECTLKSISDKKVIETVANSLLSSSSGEANLKVKDQNKLVANSGQVVKKDLTTPKEKKISEKREKHEKKSEYMFRKSQLIVPADVRDKVNNTFKLSNERKAKINGLCYHAKTKIDRYLRHQKENHLMSPKSSHKCYNDCIESDLRETRSVRRKLESDLESDCHDGLYEQVDGEVSIRSSRDTTPDRTLHITSPKKRGVSASRLSAQRSLDKKYSKSRRLDSETESGQEADSESEATNDPHFRRSSRSHSRKIEHTDDDSSHSVQFAANKSDSRSRIAENWAATFVS